MIAIHTSDMVASRTRRASFVDIHGDSEEPLHYNIITVTGSAARGELAA